NLDDIEKPSYIIELRPGRGHSYLVEPWHVVEYTNVRQITSLSMHELVRVIERARARLRLTATYTRCHRLDNTGEELQALTIHPGYDIMFFIGKYMEELLQQLGVRNPPENPLVLRRFHGIHDVYSGTKIYARIEIPDEYTIPKAEQLLENPLGNPIECIVGENKSIVELHTRIAYRFLASLGEPDIVVVSFSGGKDSIVVLDLAIKYYGRERVYPIFVDTGLEFPHTIRYVEEVEEYYGIDIEKAEARIDEAIKYKGLPRKGDRWCTGLKTRAFHEKLGEIVKSYDKVVVIVGDRDAESASRSHRSPVRRKKGYIEAAPIKIWSTALVQLYILLNKLPENKLYSYGFYRTGCYICPSLRSVSPLTILLVSFQYF
ncbi:MAG: phosphoadenosine phosphosulfate reductase family protein, partial [Desulfurococcales archaeon]|nr:phosphoadenosine phosphosulfate reductase family protein [Desulfurococcales archaeon]